MSLLPKSIHRCRRYPTKFNSGRDIPHRQAQNVINAVERIGETHETAKQVGAEERCDGLSETKDNRRGERQTSGVIQENRQRNDRSESIAKQENRG